MHTFRELVAQLGAGLAIPDMEADEDGYVALDMDGHIIHLQEDAGAGVIVLYAVLQEIERPKGKETAAEKRNRTTQVEAKRQFYAEVLGFAQQKGKGEGWAAHTYREAFDVWPNAHRDIAPVNPSEQTMSYIRSRQIRYARSKR